MSEKKNKWKFVYSKVEIDGNKEIRERILEKHIALFNLLGSSGWELVPEFSKEDVYCFRKNEDMTFHYIWKRHISLSDTSKINLGVEKMSDIANEMEKEGFRLVLLKDTYFCFMKAIEKELQRIKNRKNVCAARRRKRQNGNADRL